MADPTSPDPNDALPSDPNAPRLTGRPVYQSTLLPGRRRRRFSPWLIVPGLLILLIGALYYLLFGPRSRPTVATAGRIMFTAAAAPGGGSRLWSCSGTAAGSAEALGGSLDGDSQPAFSADGNQILFLNQPAGGINQVFLADADGKNRAQITRTSGAKSAPSFAPGSDTLIAYQSGPTLAVQNAGKGEASTLLPGRPRQSAQPDASDTAHAQESASTVASYAWRRGPNTDTPGLAATLDTGGVQTLAILPTLSDEPLLTRGGDPKGPPLVSADALSFVWSPDGSRLAAALLRASGGPGQPRLSGLFLLNPAGSPQTRLFVTPLNAPIGPESPTYSPDGRWLTFELWRQPDLASRVRLGLWIVAADGGTPRELAKGDAGGAAFAPDSSAVYFLAPRKGGGHDLTRIGTDGGALTLLSDGRLDVTGFAVSPQAADH